MSSEPANDEWGINNEVDIEFQKSNEEISKALDWLYLNDSYLCKISLTTRECNKNVCWATSVVGVAMSMLTFSCLDEANLRLTSYTWLV